MFNHTIPKIFLILFLLIELTGTLLNPSPAAGFLLPEEEMYPIFLPIVVIPPIVESTVTVRGEDRSGYGSPWWVLGYINSVVPQPVYSVSIAIELIIDPYCGPDDDDFCPPYETTEIVYPAFPATLPGQENPFSWDMILGKNNASVIDVKVISASLDNDSDKTYYPLTVLEWSREGETVVGKVRNDSGKTLDQVRVVVFSKNCSWRESILNNRSLQPEQETNFKMEYTEEDDYSCEGDEVKVIGQGYSD